MRQVQSAHVKNYSEDCVIEDLGTESISTISTASQKSISDYIIRLIENAEKMPFLIPFEVLRYRDLIRNTRSPEK